jgi:hypothetical protein
MRRVLFTQTRVTTKEEGKGVPVLEVARMETTGEDDVVTETIEMNWIAWMNQSANLVWKECVRRDGMSSTWNGGVVIVLLCGIELKK